jgi:hypothetical protein
MVAIRLILPNNPIGQTRLRKSTMAVPACQTLFMPPCCPVCLRTPLCHGFLIIAYPPAPYLLDLPNVDLRDLPHLF